MPGGSFVDGQIPTLAQVNAWLTSVATSDLQAGAVTAPKIAALPAAHVHHSVAQSIANDITTTLAFDSERFDTDTIHDLATNNTRLTCRTAGKYLAAGSAEFDANVTGERRISIVMNGAITLVLSSQLAVNGPTRLGTVTPIVQLAVGDYLEMRVYQSSGAALNVAVGAQYTPEFSMIWLSP